MKFKQPYKLTSEQRKRMNEEINRQIVESDRKFAMDHDATVLYTLHQEFGFGEKRLRRFWDACFKEIIGLRNHYELTVEDDGWICTKKLLEIGVDIEKWYKEVEEKNGK